MTADSMAKFIAAQDCHRGSMDDEPHTALEDARDYEAAILAYILRDITKKQLMALGR
jgi:hypothetical protein